MSEPQFIRGTKTSGAKLAVGDGPIRDGLMKAQADGLLVKIETDSITFVGRVISSAHEDGGPSFFQLEAVSYEYKGGA